MKSTNTKRIYICIIAMILLSNMVMAQRINVNPTIINYNVSDAGASSTQTITITNLSDKKQAYQLSLGDWIRDSIGGHKYYPPGTISRSCSPWISFDNALIEIEPQKAREVRVTLKAPSDPKATNEMKWAMIFVQNVMEQTGDENKGGKMKATIREVYRIGIHVYQTPSNAMEKQAKAISIVESKLEKNVYDFSMSNTGKAMLECKVRSVLTSLANGEEIKLEEIEFPIFPEGKRIVKLAIPVTVKSGKYSMLTILEYDNDKPLEALETNIVVQ